MQERFDDLFDDLPTSGRLRMRRDLTQRVATVLDSERASQLYLAFMRRELDAPTFDAGLDRCIFERGMTREEIEAAFPPQPAIAGSSDLSFHRKALMATILWQEWHWVGQRRPKGNIRHFWYTHLMYTLMRVMGDTHIHSIFTCYNRILRDLVRYEGFRYADLNFVSTKSKLCEAIFTDSPYPNLILACEKESYHAYLKRLAHVFHLTFISLGGQGSYGVYEDLVFDFMSSGIDLDQAFRIFVISDYDPQGYDIQAAAKEHLERAGIRRVTIERVYLRPEHITPGIVERYAVPYEVQKTKASSTKGACTLYNKFGALTGGIYKRRGTWVQFPKNGDGTYHVPQLTDGAGECELCRVELDNFQEDVLLQLLIDALERVIDGAEYYYAAAQKIWRQTIRSRAVEAAQALIQRAVQEKLRPFLLALRDIRDRLQARWDELTADEETLIQHVEDDRDFQVESLQERIDTLQAQIEELEEEQAALERQQASFNQTADDVVDFLHAVERAVVPAIPEAQRLLEPAEGQLDTYAEEQEATQAEAVANRFNHERVPIRDVIDCSAHAGMVFQRARAGAQTFEAGLSFAEQRRITTAAEDDLEAQQETMTVEVPDLPHDIVEDVAERVGGAERLLDQAQRTGAIPDRWRILLNRLERHYLRGAIGWNPWENWDDGGWRR